jgi:hypothetical protein
VNMRSSGKDGLELSNWRRDYMPRYEYGQESCGAVPKKKV